MSTQPLFLGIVSGQRRRTHAEVADRAARIAGGLQKLGVKQGDSACILMRNDIAFIEAAYAAMRLGAYAVPVNWHFKSDEVNYVIPRGYDATRRHRSRPSRRNGCAR